MLYALPTDVTLYRSDDSRATQCRTQLVAVYKGTPRRIYVNNGRRRRLRSRFSRWFFRANGERVDCTLVMNLFIAGGGRYANLPVFDPMRHRAGRMIDAMPSA